MGDFKCESNLFNKYKHLSASLSSNTAHEKPKQEMIKLPSDTRALYEELPTNPNCERLIHSSRLVFARVRRVKMEETTGKEEELQKFLGKVDEIGKHRFGVMSDLHLFFRSSYCQAMITPLCIASQKFKLESAASQQI